MGIIQKSHLYQAMKEKGSDVRTDGNGYFRYLNLTVREYIFFVCCETHLPELLQRPVISPLLEEIAGLHIPLTSESDMIVLTSERGLRASSLSVVGAVL